jgi:hypothetical protein
VGAPRLENLSQKRSSLCFSSFPHSPRFRIDIISMRLDCISCETPNQTQSIILAVTLDFLSALSGAESTSVFEKV